MHILVIKTFLLNSIGILFFNERAIFFAFNVHSENLGPMTVNSFPWMASYYYFGLINLQEKARSETSI